jgi:MADS-box transcription factor
MADLSAVVPDEHASPSQDDLQQPGNGAVDRKRGRMSAAGDDDDDDDDKTGRERRKIEIKFIQDKSRRHITFSKRKAGIMKKVRSPPTVASRRASTRLFWFLRQHQLQHKHNPPVAYFSRHLRADHLFFFFFQAYELSVLTGTQVLLLVVSETGLVYTFTTPKLQPLVTKPEGKNLIQVPPS